MIGKAWNTLTLAVVLAAAAQPAAAQETGVLASKIELEKSTPAAEGEAVTKTYITPDVVVPGDRVRVSLTFTNNGTAPAAGVNLVNPIPDGLVFEDTADTASFAVSTDGGKTFGTLASLTVRTEAAGTRPATAADVTHVRWLWPDSIAPGHSRSVAFFGRVR